MGIDIPLEVPMMLSVTLLVMCLARAASAGVSEIPLMPEALEMELALSAAPQHLRAGAAVLLLGKQGYVAARKGSNGFTCLVGRSQPMAVAPMCYDVEGTRTVVALMIDEAAMRARGESEESITKAAEEGFRTGKYSPERPGSPHDVAGAGAPGSRRRRSLLRPSPDVLRRTSRTRTSVDDEDRRYQQPRPHGMIIVPLGKEEQKAIQAEHEALVKNVREFLER
jgi:hypothetical protein